MIFRRRATLALLIALFALALPATASAASTYTVDSLEDQPDKEIGLGDCETAVGTCTLRAAIQELNVSTGTNDKIDFEPSFQGDPGDTIALSSPLPSIVHPILIDGDGLFDNRCMNDTFSINGPCIEITAPNASTPALVVDNADGVTIEGLSVTGSRTAISVINSSSSFVAHGNWLGVKLDGTAGANTTGIFLDPNSNGATIGGTAASDRNVVGNNSAEGLDIEGADNADVLGNYFGVKPDGSTQAANGRNIEITDSTASGGFEAENNEVGATIANPASTSAECDGGCNVISGAFGRGLDLNGDGAGANEAPASGPTTVHGNFAGLNAAGTAAISNGSASIFAGGADHVTVGAATFSSPIPPEANYVAGETEGISSGSGGNDFEARGNSIGLAPDGTAVPAPISGGIFVVALSVSEGATIESNHIRMPGGIAIEHRFGEGRILENDIEGGAVGVWQWASLGGGLIAGNVVEDSVESGIILESPDTDVRRNSIFDSAGPGIKVRNPPGIAVNGSQIGNDTTEGENLIEGSDGPAIEILEEATEPGSTTEIARNRGSDNGGLFIDLVAGANEGIGPPAIVAATKTGASGTAEAGAVVRVFRKASAEAGEIASFLGEAVADGSGKWKVTYTSVPGGTRVATTQTSEEGGTSELATTSVPADPPTCADTPSMCVQPDPPVNPSPPLCPAVPGGCNPLPMNPPLATITKGPKAKSASTMATFKFKSSVAGSTFECKLDGKPFKKCKSPKTYKNLKPGQHVFKVRAKNQAGNVGKVAKRKFTVLE